MTSGSDTATVIDFDRNDDSLAHQLHDIVRTTFRESPVTWTEHHGGHWIISDYRMIHEILRSPDRFNSSSVNIPGAVGAGDKLVPLELDGEEHTRYRDLLLPLFSPKRMAEIEPLIADLTRELIAEARAGESFEVVESLAMPLPVTVFLSLMGWPLEDRPKLTRWVTTLLGGSGDMSAEERQSAIAEAGGQVMQYFTEMIEQRRASGSSEDYTATVVAGRLPDGTEIPHQRLLDMLLLLMMAGLDTVKSSLSFALMRLATRPDLQELLADDPALIPEAVEEFLRWDPPAWPARVVTDDIEFHGHRFSAGDRVLLAFTAGNADTDEFTDPDELDFERDPNRHLTFSAGPHRCLGSHLARLELRIALTQWFEAMPSFELDPATPPDLHLGGVFGLNRLNLVAR